jgi:hypothetical protein
MGRPGLEGGRTKKPPPSREGAKSYKAAKGCPHVCIRRLAGIGFLDAPPLENPIEAQGQSDRAEATRVRGKGLIAAEGDRTYSVTPNNAERRTLRPANREKLRIPCPPYRRGHKRSV